MAINTHTEILRSSAQRPPIVINAQDPQVQHGGDVNPLTLDLENLAESPMRLLVLKASGSWAEVSWSEPTTAIGVQFWGDANDGVARILVDGTEEWRGSTQGATVTFEQYIEIDNLPNAPHTARVEAINDAMLPSGGVDVAIAAFGAGTPGAPQQHKQFIPFVSR